MEWIEPKTDWTKETPFTYVDYNRIRNNLLFLNDFLNNKFPDVAKEIDLGEEKSGYTNDYYATEFNAFENALESFTRIGTDLNIGTRSYYSSNSQFIGSDALNRIEKCCIRWLNINPVVTDVILEPTSFEANKGDSYQLTLTVLPSDAEYSVQWVSSNTKIATVDKNGLVMVLSDGKFTISAIVSQSGFADITKTSNGVGIIAVESITISPTESTFMTIGDELTYTVDVQPSNATYKNDWEVLYPKEYRDDEWQVWEITRLNNTKYKIKSVNDYLNYVYIYESASSAILSYRHIDTRSLPYRFRNYNMYDLLANHVKIGNKYSNTGAITTYTQGSYFDDVNITNNVQFYTFQYIANNVDGTNIATMLLSTSDMKGLLVGYKTRNDSQAPWRRVVAAKINTNFSSNLKSALKSASKTVMSSATATTSYTAKYHLPSYTEFGKTDSHITALGTAYDFLKNISDLNVRYADASLNYIATRSYYYDSEEKFYELPPDKRLMPMNDHQSSDPDVWGLGLDHYAFPLFFLSNAIYVKRLDIKNPDFEDDNNYYAIDWSGQSGLQIKDIPLGSEIIDLFGARNTSVVKATSITLSNNSVTVQEGKGTTITVTVLPNNATNKNLFTVINTGDRFYGVDIMTSTTNVITITGREVTPSGVGVYFTVTVDDISVNVPVTVTSA